MALVGDATIEVTAEPVLLALLREFSEEQRRCRESLARLVAIAEERAALDRELATLARSLDPQTAEAPLLDVDKLDWHRDPRGRVWIWAEGGSREPNAEEAAALRAAGAFGKRGG